MSGYYDREDKVLYRSRHGIICGVCRGLAEYLNFSVFWTRVLFVVAMIFTQFWVMVGVYIVAAILIKPEPVVEPETDDDREFYHSYTTSRAMAFQRLKRAFDNLDRRIQRMENVVTSREYDWDRRFKDC